MSEWFWKRSAAVVHAPSLGEKKRLGVCGCRGETQMFFICGSPVAVPVSDSIVLQFVADTGTSSHAANLQAASKKEVEESSFQGFYKTPRGFYLTTTLLYMNISTPYTNSRK